jgi:hypothetical protein
LIACGLNDEISHLERFVALLHNGVMRRNVFAVDLYNGFAEIPV